MQDILFIRFGALGDLCLLGWTLSRLAAAPGAGGRRITLATKARFADLAARLHGVDEVLALSEPGGLRDLVRLAADVRRREFAKVIDAHQVVRSRLLLGLLARRPAAVLRKDTVARLRLLRRGAVDPRLRRHMRDRFDALLADAGLPAGEPTVPLSALTPQRARGSGTTDAAEPPRLGLAPGAQWEPKRWPAAYWADIARRFRAASSAPLRVFLGPREEAWYQGSDLAVALGDVAPVEIVRERPLPEVAALLAGCRLLVCNDSGLMHLAEAVGTPVAACFGPTVAAFGYTPRLEASTVLEVVDLPCRPCSRNGKRPCHRQDLACLVQITPDRMWREITTRGPWPKG
ncbi:MAG: glycosyltransferase family 9 protein [Candidatus Krumholzibacteria bacterium]|jgi:ADP-heptose:LPS heptosyltransferase|nr:glycosyltransferase family 9 protein [Candidatus Krumholzibacteria bacterium]